MARGVNKVIIVGRLGKDPESHGTVTGFTVATSEQWKDKNTGEKQERTEWHRVKAFGRLGEICAQYLQKGKEVYIEGKLSTNKWTDNNGQDRYTTEIIANEMQMLGGKSEQSNYRAEPRQDVKAKPDAYADFDDDIPF